MENEKGRERERNKENEDTGFTGILTFTNRKGPK
jgi:hypothetical protein